jgi:site-specific DNA-methyltransferase (adenine-specific)
MNKDYKLIVDDCIDWMSNQKQNSIDCIITSPPYNLNIKYGDYNDSISRDSYLKWIGDVASSCKNVLKDNGQIFLNVGYSNSDPFVSMDVAQVFRKYFILQNNFTWVKHIMVNDTGYGQYKPILSDRYASATTESIFHFTKKGDVKIDRVAIGQRNKTHPIWPELYSEGRHIANTRRKIAKKMKFKNYKDVLANSNKEQLKEFKKEVENLLKKKPYEPDKKKCIGNAWFIPYTPTSKLSKQIGAEDGHNFRTVARANHPATFPEKLPEQCIKVSGIKKGSIVYDPFLGTGTTIIAALKHGMIGIGTDIDKNYVNFSKRRIEAISKENLEEFEKKSEKKMVQLKLVS